MEDTSGRSFQEGETARAGNSLVMGKSRCRERDSWLERHFSLNIWEHPGICFCPHQGAWDLSTGPGLSDLFPFPQPPGAGIDECPDPGPAFCGYLQFVAQRDLL